MMRPYVIIAASFAISQELIIATVVLVITIIVVIIGLKRYQSGFEKKRLPVNRQTNSPG